MAESLPLDKTSFVRFYLLTFAERTDLTGKSLFLS
jgi:hypothetical protein